MLGNEEITYYACWYCLRNRFMGWIEALITDDYGNSQYFKHDSVLYFMQQEH